MKEMTVICCRPITETTLSEQEANEMAEAFRVLGDATRLRILSMIAGREGGEVCACELVSPLGLSQPTVSHHLKVLTEAGFLRREKRGVWVHYIIQREALRTLRKALD